MITTSIVAIATEIHNGKVKGLFYTVQHILLQFYSTAIYLRYSAELSNICIKMHTLFCTRDEISSPRTLKVLLKLGSPLVTIPASLGFVYGFPSTPNIKYKKIMQSIRSIMNAQITTATINVYFD